MSVPLPVSGSNVQRWLLTRLVQQPTTDKFGNPYHQDFIDGTRNVLINCVYDWQDEIVGDGGAIACGEVFNGWCLCLVEAQVATINMIEADPRSQVIQFPNQTLESTLTTPQRNQVENALLTMGMTQAEINAFDLRGKTVREIFDWVNVGVCTRSWNEVTKTITLDRGAVYGMAQVLDTIIDNFNVMKNALL